MSYEKISCRIAIQMCVGHFPDGRERHRTFSLRHVRPDASMEAIMGLIRALTPVHEYGGGLRNPICAGMWSSQEVSKIDSIKL